MSRFRFGWQSANQINEPILSLRILMGPPRELAIAELVCGVAIARRLLQASPVQDLDISAAIRDQLAMLQGRGSHRHADPPHT